MFLHLILQFITPNTCPIYQNYTPKLNNSIALCLSLYLKANIGSILAELRQFGGSRWRSAFTKPNKPLIAFATYIIFAFCLHPMLNTIYLHNVIEFETCRQSRCRRPDHNGPSSRPPSKTTHNIQIVIIFCIILGFNKRSFLLFLYNGPNSLVVVQKTIWVATFEPDVLGKKRYTDFLFFVRH